VKFNEVVRQEQAFNGAVPLISLRSFMCCTNFFFSYAACSGDFHETQAAVANAVLQVIKELLIRLLQAC
jgi:hypothetical protein